MQNVIKCYWYYTNSDSLMIRPTNCYSESDDFYFTVSKNDISKLCPVTLGFKLLVCWAPKLELWHPVFWKMIKVMHLSILHQVEYIQIAYPCMNLSIINLGKFSEPLTSHSGLKIAKHGCNVIIKMLGRSWSTQILIVNKFAVTVIILLNFMSFAIFKANNVYIIWR